MPAYYNEIDPHAAQMATKSNSRWPIAPGDVDERSIVEVQPDDLRGYQQCHFFAGIGGWSYALRLAGIPNDRPVWTGSCPCQPFSTGESSVAAKMIATYGLRSSASSESAALPSIFGEQVAGVNGLAWIDHVFADLEDEDYAVGAADLPAAARERSSKAAVILERPTPAAKITAGGEYKTEMAIMHRCMGPHATIYGILFGWFHGRPRHTSGGRTTSIERMDATGRRWTEGSIPRAWNMR